MFTGHSYIVGTLRDLHFFANKYDLSPHDASARVSEPASLSAGEHRSKPCFNLLPTKASMTVNHINAWSVLQVFLWTPLMFCLCTVDQTLIDIQVDCVTVACEPKDISMKQKWMKEFDGHSNDT